MPFLHNFFYVGHFSVISFDVITDAHFFSKLLLLFFCKSLWIKMPAKCLNVRILRPLYPYLHQISSMEKPGRLVTSAFDQVQQKGRRSEKRPLLQRAGWCMSAVVRR